MGATFSRIKNWIAETLTFADLNAEIDNILNNLDPSGVDDYSTNATEMQTTTDPGESGTESLATSLAGELERLRFAIKEIKGTTQWYETGATTLLELSNTAGGGLPANRISSGKSLSTSSQAAFLVPSGSTDEVTLAGATTDFVYIIEDTQYTISTDVTLDNLVAAPSSNNAAAVDDTTLGDEDFTKYQGEYGTTITMDAVGSEISSLVGEYAAFKINNGSADEYFIAFVETSTTLTKCRRGYFFDENDNPIPRIAIADDDPITLMKLTWVFANTSGALVTTNNNVRVSAIEPTSPSAGDYWLDLANDKWKKFDSGAYVDADATLVGVCIQDSSDVCVAARSFDFYTSHQEFNTIDLEYDSATEVHATNMGQGIAVYGTTIRYGSDYLRYDITANLDSGVSESASTTYYLYVKENGAPVISDVIPYDRNGDLKGYYHPHNTWRCVGSIANDGSSDFDTLTLDVFTYNEATNTNITMIAGDSDWVNWSFTVNEYGDAQTLTPPFGIWDAYAHATLDSNGATTTGRIVSFIDTIAGNDPTNLSFTVGRTDTTKRTASGSRDFVRTNRHEFVITRSTSIYFKIQATTSITNLRYGSSLKLVRRGTPK